MRYGMHDLLIFIGTNSRLRGQTLPGGCPVRNLGSNRNHAVLVKFDVYAIRLTCI